MLVRIHSRILMSGLPTTLFAINCLSKPDRSVSWPFPAATVNENLSHGSNIGSVCVFRLCLDRSWQAAPARQDPQRLRLQDRQDHRNPSSSCPDPDQPTHQPRTLKAHRPAPPPDHPPRTLTDTVDNMLWKYRCRNLFKPYTLTNCLPRMKN